MRWPTWWANDYSGEEAAKANEAQNEPAALPETLDDMLARTWAGEFNAL